jgi:hypothetical protein
MAPGVLDNYNFDKAERDTALADGVPLEFLRAEKEVEQMRQQRAAAQAEAQKQAAALQAAEAVSKVRRVPADSPVGKVIQSQIPAVAA